MAQDIDRAGKVAVLMGGRSAERDISLKSGQAVLDALLRLKVDAHAIDSADQGFVQTLVGEAFTRVFIALHGRGGEDGVIQGLLETLGLPYTGSHVLASALAMDKVRSKQVWMAEGLPTPEFVRLQQGDEIDSSALVDNLGLPLIVKPAHEGSSIGMTKVNDKDELETACLLAFRYDHEILLECWVEGDEYTLAILAGENLPLIRLLTPHEFYDFDAKYLSDSTEYQCPCGLPPQQEQLLVVIARQAFQVLGAEGWGRVDFMLDKQAQPWLIEVNTVPGLTDHSLVPMAACQTGMGFDELVWKILLSAMDNAIERVN
ncbi:MAG: D-alanine--D-alanine ligase [Gammaproteobacteria bacterium]|nr:D-alanine--D-alanine ligase [Gammaproteobacteria bacterium]